MATELERGEIASVPLASAASGEAFIARLSVAFADPVRLKIITELFRREMSPSQFYAAFGGGSLESVCRQFKKLEQHGWLRLVHREAPSGKRRAENFYRAPELAVFDEAMWDLLPQTLKEEFSWRIFTQFAERVKWAFEAETIDAREDRQFLWMPLTLDEKGRALVFSIVTDLFYSLFEEQRDANFRLERSGETPIHATVAISAFDSPTTGSRSDSYRLGPDKGGTDRALFFVRLSKVFRHPANLRIITELNRREMSPSGFHREFGERYDLDQRDVHRRFGTLAADGWLKLSRENTGGKRRGATERFFRAAGPAVCNDQSWSKVPPKFKERETWKIFEQIAVRMQDAMAAGTFDSRADRAHMWMAYELDERGWDQMRAATQSVIDLVRDEEQRAAARLARPGAEAPKLATVSLAVFESPKGAPSRPGVSDEPWVY